MKIHTMFMLVSATFTLHGSNRDDQRTTPRMPTILWSRTGDTAEQAAELTADLKKQNSEQRILITQLVQDIDKDLGNIKNVVSKKFDKPLAEARKTRTKYFKQAGVFASLAGAGEVARRYSQPNSYFNLIAMGTTGLSALSACAYLLLGYGRVNSLQTQKAQYAGSIREDKVWLDELSTFLNNNPAHVYDCTVISQCGVMSTRMMRLHDCFVHKKYFGPYINRF